jgi:hypothetical protein
MNQFDLISEIELETTRIRKSNDFTHYKLFSYL